MRGLWGTHKVHQSLSPVGSLTRSASWKPYQGPPGAQTIGWGSHKRKWAAQSADVPPNANTAEDSPTSWRFTQWGADRRGQLATFWRSAISEVEGAANQGGNGQHVEGREKEKTEALYTHYGRALDDLAGGSGDNNMRVSVS